MMIDRRDGIVHLPDGFVITPSLTRSQFEASPVFKQAKHHTGRGLYVSFTIRYGDERLPQIIAGLWFYEELLTSVSLTAYSYARSWDEVTLEGAIKTKDVHDALLRDDLGEPHAVEKVRIAYAQDTALERSVSYTFPWGSVASGHDQRGLITDIHIGYGDRQRWAQRDYQRRHTPSWLARLRDRLRR